MKTISFIGISFTFFGGDQLSSQVNSSNIEAEMPYQYERMGYTSTSILDYSGDLVILWIVLFLVFFCVYALEFVLHAVPYIRTLC